MEQNNIVKISLTNLVLWVFLLCIAWFGHFNNWWPAALPITFTVIVCALYGIVFIVGIVCAICSNL